MVFLRGGGLYLTVTGEEQTGNVEIEGCEMQRRVFLTMRPCAVTTGLQGYGFIIVKCLTKSSCFFKF